MTSVIFVGCDVETVYHPIVVIIDIVVVIRVVIAVVIAIVEKTE